jgi:hypothetical protein
VCACECVCVRFAGKSGIWASSQKFQDWISIHLQRSPSFSFIKILKNQVGCTWVHFPYIDICNPTDSSFISDLPHKKIKRSNDRTFSASCETSPSHNSHSFMSEKPESHDGLTACLPACLPPAHRNKKFPRHEIETSPPTPHSPVV